MWYLIVGFIWMVVSGIILLFCEKATNTTVIHGVFLASMLCKLIIWPVDIVVEAITLYKAFTIDGYADTMWDNITEENEAD